jgi:hypothetical protein
MMSWPHYHYLSMMIRQYTLVDTDVAAGLSDYDDELTALSLPIDDDGLSTLDPDLLAHVGWHAVPVSVLLRGQVHYQL